MRTILQWYQSGGPFMAPLIVVGVAGLLLLVERFVAIVLKSRINTRPFIERVIALVRGGKLDEGLKLCAEHQSFLPDLGLVILRSRSRDEADLLNVAETSALTVMPTLTRRLAWLPVLAKLSMLFGALGAVANLHHALTVSPGATDSHTPLSIGIAYALRPLGVGILTAIPLVAGHAFLMNEAERLIGQLEEFSARLINALIDRPDVRLGHRN